ncbi:hypothetical protein [Raoultibacter phocaeensis]|uniref:hypothetical protein n=1 Tax=Raoultibacter phocaeensis TaxID=2479841 RepID=UPI00111B5B91|nr:hypothetical protein [Raoultibacter phocaeensis]
MGQQPQGYQQPPAYGQPYQPPHQPYGAGGYQPPQPPQTPQPPYGSYNQEPPKKKVWPWVLVGCLLIGLLGLGGCVGCVACSAIVSSDYDRSNSRYYDSYDYDPYEYDYNYDYDDLYDGYFDDYSSMYTYTYSEIMSDKNSYDNVIENGRISNGVYEVGVDIEPGRYFMEGDPTEEGYYVLYDPDDDRADSYEMDESVAYFGNYYVDLDRGDIIVFSPSGDQSMMAAADASFAPTAPYAGGLYLVGTDIPAGTYTVNLDEAAAANAASEAAAFIMKDLEWDDDSITDRYYTVKGGSHTITVKNGQWLEAYAVTLTPTDAS